MLGPAKRRKGFLISAIHPWWNFSLPFKFVPLSHLGQGCRDIRSLLHADNLERWMEDHLSPFFKGSFFFLSRKEHLIENKRELSKVLNSTTFPGRMVTLPSHTFPRVWGPRWQEGITAPFCSFDRAGIVLTDSYYCQLPGHIHATCYLLQGRKRSPRCN